MHYTTYKRRAAGIDGTPYEVVARQIAFTRRFTARRASDPMLDAYLAMQAPREWAPGFFVSMRGVGDLLRQRWSVLVGSPNVATSQMVHEVVRGEARARRR